MPSYLDRLVDTNEWANRGLLEFLGKLPPETLELTTGGVSGGSWVSCSSSARSFREARTWSSCRRWHASRRRAGTRC
jgi:hypothetical protein